MGYTINVYQYRSFTDEEWSKVLSLVPLLKWDNLRIKEDLIVHEPYESWCIYKNIDSVNKDWLKPGGTCGEEEVSLIRCLISIYAPGVFDEDSDRDEIVLASVAGIMSHIHIQHIYLTNKIIYSLDNNTLLEHKKGDNPDEIIKWYINHHCEYIDK